MRPRVFPAEDMLGRDGRRALLRASMRPRVFPAEDLSDMIGFNEAAVAPGSGSFNEAAGIPRGRLGCRAGLQHQPLPASMRPRVFPAED